MRDIKFRGKRFNDSKWVYGDLVHEKDKILIRYFHPDGQYLNYEIILKTIGQYTGLKDKNNQEIYEGDIIETLNGLHGIIMFNQETSSFGFKYIETVGCGYIKQLGSWISSYKVIGNIYDNPELIEQSKSCKTHLFKIDILL